MLTSLKTLAKRVTALFSIYNWTGSATGRPVNKNNPRYYIRAKNKSTKFIVTTAI